jgi:hypothetical protein
MVSKHHSIIENLALKGVSLQSLQTASVNNMKEARDGALISWNFNDAGYF